MENPMIIVAILIFVVLGGIAFYYFVIRKDEPIATTATPAAGLTTPPAGSDIAGDIITSFNSNESFSNIEKRVEHFNNVTPTPTNPCINDPNYYVNSEEAENACAAENACQFTYYRNRYTDNQQCERNQYLPYNTNTPDYDDPEWIGSETRKQPLNFIPACETTNYPPNPSTLTEDFDDMTLEHLKTLPREQQARNLKKVLKGPFLRALTIIDLILNLAPYVTVYECGNQNLPCECNGFKQYRHDFNIHNTNEEKALAFLTLMFGYDENISYESNITRMEGNIWLMFNKLVENYGENFCMSNINNIKNYVTDFNNALNNGRALPDFIESDEVIALIALVFTTFIVNSNAGILKSPRSDSDDGDVSLQFISEDTNVNVVDRYKYKMIVPDGFNESGFRGSIYGLQELEEDGVAIFGAEYTNMIPLFMVFNYLLKRGNYEELRCPPWIPPSGWRTEPR